MADEQDTAVPADTEAVADGSAAQTDSSPSPAAKRSRTAAPLPQGAQYVWGTGRRKRAVARVRIRPGSGNIVINKRQVAEFFPAERDQNSVVAPLQAVSMLTSWDVWVNVGGGGTTGQAGAVELGLARALSRAMPELERDLRDGGLLTRDSRMKERKKYGQRGARRRFQFSKR